MVEYTVRHGVNIPWITNDAGVITARQNLKCPRVVYQNNSREKKNVPGSLGTPLVRLHFLPYCMLLRQDKVRLAEHWVCAVWAGIIWNIFASGDNPTPKMRFFVFFLFSFYRSQVVSSPHFFFFVFLHPLAQGFCTAPFGICTTWIHNFIYMNIYIYLIEFPIRYFDTICIVSYWISRKKSKESTIISEA